MNVPKKISGTTLGFLLVVILVIIFFAMISTIVKNGRTNSEVDLKNMTYVIDGQHIKLINGLSELNIAPGSAVKKVTRYFGNEVRKDLNKDGKEDVTFLVTQTTGGSGTFYYVVAYISNNDTYVGSQSLFLGDRIAPQTTESGPGNSIIVNYADRNSGDSFAVAPSVGKSIRLILDPKTLQFGEVAQNFEGEADPIKMSLGMKQWTWIKTQTNEGKETTPNDSESFKLTFINDGNIIVETNCYNLTGTYKQSGKKIVFGKTTITTKMSCDSEDQYYVSLLQNIDEYKLTSQGQLILQSKTGSKTIILR